MTDVIPSEIREFIDAYIDSVAQLEALLLLRRDPEVTWDAESTAGRLYISSEEAAALLKKLASDGFLVFSIWLFSIPIWLNAQRIEPTEVRQPKARDRMARRWRLSSSERPG